MDYTKKTLGELLSSTNDIIKRNAVSILKQLQGKAKDDNYLFESPEKTIKRIQREIN